MKPLLPGPCETDFQDRVIAARATRSQNLIACGLGGGGLWAAIKGIRGGLKGAGAALACYAIASSTFNNAVMSAFELYLDCIN